MTRHFVADAADLPPGERIILTIGRREIGVFNVHGRYYALRNLCPHHGAPLCRGTVTGIMRSSEVYTYDWKREGEILHCPWHGWAFELASGRSLLDERLRVRTYPVICDGDQLFVEL